MSYGDRYHLVVERDEVTEVLQFLEQEQGASGFLDQQASRFLPPGWKLIRDVQIDSRPATSPPLAIASLVPAGSGPRIRLLGGLPIGPARGSYLRGGEPALALSTLSENDSVLVRRESTGEVERIRVPNSADREIPLWPYHFPPDTYEVRHGDSRVTLQIVDGIAEAAGPGAGSIRQRGRDSIDVIGTETSPKRRVGRKPITVPAPSTGTDVILIGPHPDEYMRPALPEWLSLLVGFELSWLTTDAWPDFDPAWCIKSVPTGQYEASMLSEIEPSPPRATSTGRWGTLIATSVLAPNQNEHAASLWQRYRRAAVATA